MSEKKIKKKNTAFNILKFVIFIISVFFTLTVLSISIFLYLNSPVQLKKAPPYETGVNGVKLGEGNNILFEVYRGESAQSAGMRLEKAGLIRSRYFWNLMFRINKEYIKNGLYQISMPASQMEIIRLLVSGKQILVKVTIPEGVTIKKIAEILDDAGICTAEDFLAAARSKSVMNNYNIPNSTSNYTDYLSIEGYLFPDTYMFPGNYPTDGIIKTMIENFYNKIENIYPDVFSLSMEELNKKVIMASIIEREYRLSEEAVLMSGVFYNRLNIGMALQSCATIEYIITEIQGKPHPEVIYNRDLEIKNPYNTYLMPGLPPGPISSPGVTALNAAFYPEKTEFLYFRLNDPAAGKHYFSKTLDEHIKAGSLLPKGSLPKGNL